MLDKEIKHGKEKRQSYYHSGRLDRTCRPHGGCPWCEGNREHATKIKELSAEEQEEILYDNLMAIGTLG